MAGFPPATTPSPRVCHVCVAGSDVDYFLSEILHELTIAGCDVHVVCPLDEEVRLPERWTYHHVSFSRNVLSTAHLASLFTLFRILRRGKFDLVHFHSPIAAGIGRIAGLLSGARNIVYTAHGFYFHDGMSPWKHSTFAWAERTLARITDCLLLQSREDYEYARRYMKTRRGIIEYLGNGVPTAKFAQIERPRPSHSSLVRIGFLGRLVREKGCLDLIRAVHRLIEGGMTCELIYGGKALTSDRDDVTEEINRYIHTHGLGGRVGLVGKVDDVPRFLSGLDIFALPSWREGVPRSMIEAMAAGLPVIGTNIRGCREMVQPGRTGLLVPRQNVAELSYALGRLCTDPALRLRMGLAARERAISDFDVGTPVRRQVDVYGVLLGVSRATAVDGPDDAQNQAYIR